MTEILSFPLEIKVPPVIKWTGSKRLLSHVLKNYILPSERYIEPFFGGGAMLPYRKCQKAIVSDIIPELINLWKQIKLNPNIVSSEYEERWNHLKVQGKEYYYAIRKQFNSTRNVYDFLFLTRTCMNGMIRFNKNNEFNTALNNFKDGIKPETLKKVIFLWNAILRNVDILNNDYKIILQLVTDKDFVFLDPPYKKAKGLYSSAFTGEFNFDEFLKFEYIEFKRRCL